MGLPRNKQTDELFRSILLLESIDDCYNYFEDLCTIKEIQSFCQRLEIAKMIDKGYSYQSTIEKTGVSTATIGRVKRCLEYGTGGYKLMLKRLQESESENEG